MLSVLNTHKTPNEISSYCFSSSNVPSLRIKERRQIHHEIFTLLTATDARLRAFRRPEEPKKLEPTRLGFRSPKLIRVSGF